MKISTCLGLALGLMSLGGCGIGGHWMTGDPSAGRNVKPYGAHWVKEGMTRESRRDDSWDCGAASTAIGADGPVFSRSMYDAERTPSDENDWAPYRRLLDRWSTCMSSKSYQFLGVGNCDERCLYP